MSNVYKNSRQEMNEYKATRFVFISAMNQLMKKGQGNIICFGG